MLCYMSLRGLFERIRYVEGRLRAFLLVHSFWGVLSSAGQCWLGFQGWGFEGFELIGGSWDLVSRVVSKVTIVISTYNPNSGTYNPTY